MLQRYTRHNLTWIDLTSPTPAEVRSLMQEYSLDPMIAQELLVPTFSQKVQRFGDAMYAILHFPALRGNSRAQQEIDFVIGSNFLITTRYETIDPLHAFAKAFEVDSILGRTQAHSNGGQLFVEMVRNIYRALIEESEVLRRRLIDIEERVFNGDERRMVIEISHTGRTIHDFRQALLPHKEMLLALEPIGMRMYGQDFVYHLTELRNMYERVDRTIGNLKEALTELRETNNSLLSTKQNEIMKTLTVAAFLFLPLTFVSQIFGMSNNNIPLMGSQDGFWIVLGVLACIALACFVFFKRKGWL